MTLKCKNYGLLTNTEVENENGRILVTNGLSIKHLVALWRWYYEIPPFERITLKVYRDVYKATNQRNLSSMKSVSELFFEENVLLEEL